MAMKTNNYNLIKPESTDFYDVGVQNANMDIIDEELKKANENAGDMSKSVYDKDNNGIVDNAEKLNGKTDAQLVEESRRISSQLATDLGIADTPNVEAAIGKVNIKTDSFIATKNQPNGIASLDNTANIPTGQLGNVSNIVKNLPDVSNLKATAWKDLGEINIVSNTVQINVTVPDGVNEAKLLISDIHCLGGTTSLTLRFNSDSSSKYSYIFASTTISSVGSTSRCVLGVSSISLYHKSSFIIDIVNLKQGKYAHGTFSSSLDDNASTGFGVFSYKNTDVINTINLSTDSNYNIDTANIQVWGR